MAQKPITMDLLKQIHRLKTSGISIKEIQRRIPISRNSIRKYLKKIDSTIVKQNIPLAETVYSNDVNEVNTQRLYLLTQHFVNQAHELKRTGVTRQLLWNEYCEKHENPYRYSQYCYHLNQWLKKSDLSMHMEYTPGDLMLVDFAGKTYPYINKPTGEVNYCQVFVAVLPFSGKVFCHAVKSQRTEDFAHCINEMLRYFGGVPNCIVSDNLKTAVIRSCRFEPVFTQLCHQISEHYNTTFNATRPRKPKDKAMVEKAVNIVYNRIYGPLRNESFHSIEQINQAFRIKLEELNHAAYKGSPHSRHFIFERDERDTLKQLPCSEYKLKHVSVQTVQKNYHIQLNEDRHYYSVPYQYVGKKVEVLYDSHQIEIFYQGERIAVHKRERYTKMYHTITEHMPPAHLHIYERKGWSKEYLLSKAKEQGVHIEKAAALILESNLRVEQNFKSCMGLLYLSKRFGKDRLDAACKRALLGTRVNYTIVKRILELGLDKVEQLNQADKTILHSNIRGKDYYQ